MDESLREALPIIFFFGMILGFICFVLIGVSSWYLAMISEDLKELNQHFNNPINNLEEGNNT